MREKPWWRSWTGIQTWSFSLDSVSIPNSNYLIEWRHQNGPRLSRLPKSFSCGKLKMRIRSKWNLNGKLKINCLQYTWSNCNKKNSLSLEKQINKLAISHCQYKNFQIRSLVRPLFHMQSLKLLHVSITFHFVFLFSFQPVRIYFQEHSIQPQFWLKLRNCYILQIIVSVSIINRLPHPPPPSLPPPLFSFLFVSSFRVSPWFTESLEQAILPFAWKISKAHDNISNLKELNPWQLVTIIGLVL